MATFFLSAFADEASDKLEGQITALKKAGISGIEPRSIDGPILQKTDKELWEIHKRFEEAEITVPSLGSPIGKYEIQKPFAPHFADFCRALEFCNILGTHRMRIFSFYIPDGQTARFREEALFRLSEMLKKAEEAGVTLCHENEAGIYGQNPEDVADLLTALPKLRGIYDPANYVYYGQDPEKGLYATLPSLAYCHMKDCMASDCALVPVGYGDGKVKEALQYIDAHISGEIVLTLEPHLFHFGAYDQFDGRAQKHRFAFQSSEESFAFAADALKHLLAEIGHPVQNGRG